MIVDSNVLAVCASHPELAQDQRGSPGEAESLNALSAPPPSQQPESVSALEAAGAANIVPGRVSEVYVDVQGQQQKTRQQTTEEDGLHDGACCFSADDMAGDVQRAEKYIVNIPYSVLLSIYQSLDADKGWERLAAETGYSFDKIKLLELEGARNQGSPSRSLLWELGSRNTTVRQLYGYLNSLSRYREMKILEDYVNSPAKTSFVDNGLKGLKSPQSSMDTSSTLKGSQTTSVPLPSKKSNNSMHSDSNFNFSPPMSSSDINNSLKCQGKDKQYSGKQMPIASNSSSNASAISRNEASQSHSSIQVPAMKPSNPSRQVPNSESANLIQNMIKQMPEGAQSSSSSSGHPMPGSPVCHSTSSPSSSFPTSDSPLSSSLSSLPGLESSLDVQMAVMGSASFSYTEILAATSRFSQENKLGEGAFGEVYYGVLRGNRCAVKKMFEANGQETVVERSTQVKRELTSLLKFRHENIVTLYGYAFDGETLCLVYQFMCNGSVEDRLMCKNNTAPLVWSQRLNIMLGTCQGLNFLHNMGEQPLIHGDIKSANILLDKYMEAKISDLGQAQQATAHSSDSNTNRHTHITREQATTKLYGTRAYQPLEVQSGGRPSTKSDMFSVGVVLLELFSGERAYDERREGEKFLGNYFRSLKSESGDTACQTMIDRRAGECPQEVSLAILNLAYECTSNLKRQRPKTEQLLQKMKGIDELYREKTGIKNTGMDSLPGSVHSCHLSHTSSPGGSVDNLSAAPPYHLHPQPPHHSTASQSNCTSDINLNTDSPTATHLRHPPSPDRRRPDNRLAVNMDIAADSEEASHSSPSSMPSCLKGLGKPYPVDNPINHFPEDQPLPSAFRLQQAYDNQCLNPAEKKRISQLSQCLQVEQRAQQKGGVSAMEVLPQADPAKLAQLEQFDRMNFGGSVEEKVSNTLESDPKKLAQLKQFDDQAHLPTQQNVTDNRDEADCEAGRLACDPRKLAQLRRFDDDNLKASNIVQQSQTEAETMASDPGKLSTLTQFDALKNETSVAMPPVSCSQVNPAEELANQSEATNSEFEDSSLVSQMDYLVVTSQREALEACNSMIQQQERVMPQQSSMAESEAGADSFLERYHHESTAVAADSPAPKHQDSAVAPQGKSVPAENLLLRQKKFFDLYNKLAGEMDDEDLDEQDLESEDLAGEEEEKIDDTDEQAEEDCDNAVGEWAGSSATGQCSLPVQEQVTALTASGHSTEQDESMLNYFKQREQHYEKTFKKPAQASQC